MLPSVKDFLNWQKFDWESITCVGRSSWGTSEPIESTILIVGKSPASKTLREAAQQKSMEWHLPVEFIEGAIEEEAADPSCFGFLERNNPIPSGSSCGNFGHQRSGTIGDFITLRGDALEEIYAVSNHHVFRPGNRTTTRTYVTNP